MQNDMLLAEWEDLLKKTECLYVYGAGKIAKKIITLIKQHCLHEKILGVVVSDKNTVSDDCMGFPIFQADELTDVAIPIFVAVGDRYQEEIFALLEAKQMRHVVNVYKYACLAEELPGKVEVVAIESLLKAQFLKEACNRLDIMVRLNAIGDYYAGKTDAFGLYTQMQDFRNEKGYGEIARKRFMKLLASYEKKGYDTNSEIYVDNMYQLRDGAHRLALALYHNKMFVKIRRFEDFFECEYGREWFNRHFPDAISQGLEKRYDAEIMRLHQESYTEDRLKERLCLMLGTNQDFGRGEFYQSLPLLGIEGQRPTDMRIKEYGLVELVKDKTVLDIGCNCGFLDISIADYAASVKGIEYNGALVQIADCVKNFLKKNNVTFEQGDFNAYIPQAKYDVIFSFAVHYWIGMPAAHYVEKLCSMLNENGLIVFESQDIEKDSDFESYIKVFESKGLNPAKAGIICDDGIIKRKWIALKQ